MSDKVIRFPLERTRPPDPEKMRSAAACQLQRIERPQIQCDAYVFRQPGDDRPSRCEHIACYRFEGAALCGTHGSIENRKCICARLGVCT
jgi:hypothetical protein